MCVPATIVVTKNGENSPPAEWRGLQCTIYAPEVPLK